MGFFAAENPMMKLKSCFLEIGQAARRLGSTQRMEWAAAVAQALPRLTLYPESACAVPSGAVMAARAGGTRKILIAGLADGFQGDACKVADTHLLVCDATPTHVHALRRLVSFLRPTLTGLRSSIGLGDRLGLATPGHLAAVRGSGLMPVPAQQSIREMARTGRTAQQVMDDATFGVFEAGYDAGFGADADHLKTPADVDATAAAGFVFFTIDPSEDVDGAADALAPAALAERFAALIAADVPGAAEWRAVYAGRTFRADATEIVFDDLTLLRAAVKYGRAVARAEAMAHHIARTVPRSEIELSVDETATPTSLAEHYFIAHELRRRGVRLVSLAPRYVGAFEKGVDYKGDLQAFERALAGHAAIAHQLGPYKLGIHSGSDKFLIYPLVARLTEGRFHLKTAGTSYLEALRVAARKDPVFFRELVGFCRHHYEADKASYHVSAVLSEIPPADRLTDTRLEETYLEQPGGRQILHVTFGSVLTARDAQGRGLFRERLMALLEREAAAYVDVLQHHIGRHIQALTRA